MVNLFVFRYLKKPQQNAQKKQHILPMIAYNPKSKKQTKVFKTD